MDLTVGELTEKDAMELCQWRYPEPYDIYNCPDWDTVKRENWGIAREEKRKDEFYSVYSGESYIGFFRLIKGENCLTLGLGLHPKFCGRGLGPAVMSLIRETAKSRYGSVKIRLEVRAFNQRAIKCYQSAGFVTVGQSSRSTPAGLEDVIRMEL